MRLIINLLVAMAMCLITLVSAGGGGACVECAMEAHHGVALVESWTGRDARNAGSIDEATLHDKIRDQLEKFCDGSKAGFCEWPDLGHIPVRYAKGQKNGLPKYAGDSKLTFSVHASWTHEANREILINRAAVGVGRLVSRKWGNPNCYAVEGEADYCNIGYIYRVNLPDVNRVKNFILLRFSGGGPITDYFRCCSSQKFLEFDDYAKEMKESFSLDYSQQARCLIVDDITCGRCGEKCNTCNEKCHDGCIKGKC